MKRNVLMLSLLAVLASCDTFHTVSRDVISDPPSGYADWKAAVEEMEDTVIVDEVVFDDGVYFLQLRNRGVDAWIEVESGRVRIGSSWVGRTPTPQEIDDARSYHSRLELLLKTKR